MDLGKLIKREREKKNLTVRAFEKLTGIVNTQMSRYENGHNQLKEDKAMEILMKAFDYPYSKAKDLIAEFKIEEAKEQLSDTKKEKIFGSQLQEIEIDMKKVVPVFESVGAGFAVVDQNQILEYVDITGFGYEAERMFGAKITGDCMSPTIKDKDIVMILKNGHEITNNQIYVVRHGNDEYTVKRLKKVSDSHYLLVPDNPIFTDHTIVITPENKDEYEMVGLVLEVRRRGNL